MTETIIDAPIWDKGREAECIMRVKERGLPLQEEQLLIGDVVISERVCFEIKRVTSTVNDIKASLFDDRIHQQSKDRQENYPINTMIFQIEDKQKLTDAKFRGSQLRSLMKTLELSFDTHIHITESTDETIDLIYEYWEHEKKGVKYVSPCNKTPKGKTLPEQQLYLLSGLIDCGDVSVLELLNHFKTPMNVFLWIMNMSITFTVSGNPRKPVLPAGLMGYGPQFFLKNQLLLRGKNDG